MAKNTLKTHYAIVDGQSYPKPYERVTEVTTDLHKLKTLCRDKYRHWRYQIAIVH